MRASDAETTTIVGLPLSRHVVEPRKRCGRCDKSLSRAGYYKHMKRVGGCRPGPAHVESASGRRRADVIVCGRCPRRFGTLTELCGHVAGEADHWAGGHEGADYALLEATFQSRQEFSHWREGLEWRRGSGGQPLVAKAAPACRKNSSILFQYLYCRRSGAGRYVAEQRRRRKAKASVKLGWHCTAFIRARYAVDGTVSVIHCAAHYGHDDQDGTLVGETSRESEQLEVETTDQPCQDFGPYSSDQLSVEVDGFSSSEREVYYAASLALPPPNLEHYDESVDRDRDGFTEAKKSGALVEKSKLSDQQLLATNSSAQDDLPPDISSEAYYCPSSTVRTRFTGTKRAKLRDGITESLANSVSLVQNLCTDEHIGLKDLNDIYNLTADFNCRITQTAQRIMEC